MQSIVVIESHVTEGHVGNRAAVPVLQLLGYHVLEVPTVHYTARVGWPGFAGMETPPELMTQLLEYVESRQPMPVVTGYLGSQSTVDMLVEKVPRWTGPLIVDPVMGDHPGGLYVSPEVAEKMTRLMPFARVVTPNRFEAEYLAGMEITDDRSALAAAKKIAVMGPETVVITSCHGENSRFARNILWTSDYKAVITTPLVDTPRTVYGAGDMFTALVAGLMMQQNSEVQAVQAASGIVTKAIARAWERDMDTVDPLGEMLEFLLPLRQGKLEEVSMATGAQLKSLD